MTELVQDPRPVEEKQEVVLQVRPRRAAAGHAACGGVPGPSGRDRAADSAVACPCCAFITTAGWLLCHAPGSGGHAGHVPGARGHRGNRHPCKPEDAAAGRGGAAAGRAHPAATQRGAAVHAAAAAARHRRARAAAGHVHGGLCAGEPDRWEGGSTGCVRPHTHTHTRMPQLPPRTLPTPCHTHTRTPPQRRR
jgi:hypothetical protein